MPPSTTVRWNSRLLGSRTCQRFAAYLPHDFISSFWRPENWSLTSSTSIGTLLLLAQLTFPDLFLESSQSRFILSTPSSERHCSFRVLMGTLTPTRSLLSFCREWLYEPPLSLTLSRNLPGHIPGGGGVGRKFQIRNERSKFVQAKRSNFLSLPYPWLHAIRLDHSKESSCRPICKANLVLHTRYHLVIIHGETHFSPFGHPSGGQENRSSLIFLISWCHLLSA